MIIAIDPGSEKCGFALLDDSGKALEKSIVPPHEISRLISKHPASAIIIGDSAAGKKLKNSLSLVATQVNIFLISEKHSTLEARKLYWEEHKPAGIWKIIPLSFRFPPVPIDDYAAVILGKRYLNC
jgi:RNase H-fold protein (predicted Holliday junction resolvase)